MGIIQAAVGYEDDGTIICARERTEVIQEEIDLCGYFVIVTSKQMTAEEALELYKSRDVSEKLFATVYKGNIIKNLIMDCQSYTKYRPNETTGGIFVSWRRKEELPTGA